MIVAALALPVAALTPRVFAALAAIIRRECGIALSDEKRLLLERRIAPRVQELGLPDAEAYAQLLAGPRGAEELETLVELITTHHTSFFREPEHFRLLGEQLLPALAGETPIRIWSAAVSSGEEAWTLAMVVAEAERRMGRLAVEITGSDISRRVLAVAERAIYPMKSLDSVDQDLRRRYFERGVNEQAGRCRVSPLLRARVTFRRLNLCDAHYPLPPQHVIFCRNVMIYFEADRRNHCIARLAATLVPGGYLFVGYSESLGSEVRGLVRVAHGVYQRA